MLLLAVQIQSLWALLPGSLLGRYQFRLCKVSSKTPYLRSASWSWWTFFLFVGSCVFISSMSTDICFYCFASLLHPPAPLLLWLGTPLWQLLCLCRCSRVIQQDEMLLLSESQPSWVRSGMKMCCLYHPQAEELHSGVAHQFWINRSAQWERSVKYLVFIVLLCFLLLGFFPPHFILLRLNGMPEFWPDEEESSRKWGGFLFFQYFISFFPKDCSPRRVELWW